MEALNVHGSQTRKPTSSQPPMSLPQSLSSEWRALFELVTAALLVAVVYPQTQSIYQRVSQPSNEAPSFSSPDYAYAASAVLRPGQTSTLRYGEDTQELATDAVPTMLRQFQELRLSDSEEESTEDSSPSLSEAEHPQMDSSPRRPAIKKHAPAMASSASISNVGSTSASPGTVRFSSPPINVARASTPARLVFNGEVKDAPLTPPRTAELTFTVPLNDMVAAMQTSGNSASMAAVARGASAPPEFLPAPKPFNTPASNKGKGKGKATPSSASRATSTHELRPVTRSRSAAPGGSASAGGVVLGDGEIPPAESYIRRSNKHASWFESSSRTAIAYPPDFSIRKDVELEDVFIHWANDAYQLWVWEEDREGNAVWKRVWLGYARPSDGRQLSVTPARKQPSWISEQWSLKTAKKRAA